jgi:RNA polymerase sigma-70 factor (ECF subfamily)
VRTQQEQLTHVLHEQHAATLWSFAVRPAYDPADAHHVAQETLLPAWRRSAVLDQSHRSARAWRCTVARRGVKDDWRTMRSRSEFVTDAPSGQAGPGDADPVRQSGLVTDLLPCCVSSSPEQG